MKNEAKNIINLILVAVGLAMGVAVIVLTIIDTEIKTIELIRLLGISVASFGLLALNNLQKKQEFYGQLGNKKGKTWKLYMVADTGQR